MKLFHLQRDVDSSGISGTGRVADGIEFDDGTCVLRWLTDTATTELLGSMQDVKDIHGHGDNTQVVVDHEENVERFIDQVIEGKDPKWLLSRPLKVEEVIVHIARDGFTIPDYDVHPMGFDGLKSAIESFYTGLGYHPPYVYKEGDLLMVDHDNKMELDGPFFAKFCKDRLGLEVNLL